MVRAGTTILYLYVKKRKDLAMGTNFAVAPGEYLQEWIDGNGMSVGEFAVELGVAGCRT